MQYPTATQMRNAERNKTMVATNPIEPKPSNKTTSPKVILKSEPTQEVFPFAKKYNILAREEIDKDVDTLLKLLDKFGCSPEDIDPIVGRIKKSSTRIRIQEIEREKEKKKALEEKKKRDALHKQQAQK